MTVFQIGHQGVFPILGIVYRFRQTGSFVWALLIQPIPECLQYRLLLFKTELFSLLRSMIFCFWVPLTLKQLGAELYSLHRRKAVIILLPFRYGICEITSHMCPARAAFDIRQIVITLVSVGLQISTEPMQERCCMELCPCLCVMIEQDRRKPIFSTAEEPHLGICFRITLRLIQYLNPGFIL